MHSLQRKAPAKINLGLRVLRRREDDFHEIETVLLAIEWWDLLTYHLTNEWSFSCSDPELPTDESNLCVLAAHSLAQRAGRALRGRLVLEKSIPHGAGLGGGSSNAAATVRLLSEAWNIDMGDIEQHELAAQLGSDVPFFLHNQPMVSTGRGEVLEPLARDGDFRLSEPILVVKPRISVSTARAYGLVTPSGSPGEDLRSVVLSKDFDRWRKELINDFERPINSLFPETGAEIARMNSHGAAYSALSGSGSAVFGIFERWNDAQAAFEEARQRGLETWLGRALSAHR